MNLYSAIELGKNAILTQQEVFQIIGHNMANVNTAGYSRQVAELESIGPSVLGLNESGRGVSLGNIRSVRDRFIDNQIVESLQHKGKYENLGDIMSTIESLFDESGSLGISDSLTNFFNAWNDLANQPTNVPTRDSLVSKTQNFTQTMNNTYERLIDQQQSYDANIAALVDDVNSLAADIGTLNQKIAYAKGSSTPTNDLMDTRDRKIRELSEKIGINFYYEQSNDSVTIEVAGKPLVLFNEVNQLSAVRNAENSNYYDVYMEQNGQATFDLTPYIERGQMGALIQARDGETVTGAGTVTPGASAGGYTALTFSQDHGLQVGDLITIGGQTRSVVSVSSTTDITVDDFNPALAGAQTWEKRDGYIPEYKKSLDKLAADLIYNVNKTHETGYTFETPPVTGQNFFQMSDGPAGITPTADGTTTVSFSSNIASLLNVGDIIKVGGQTRLITGVTPTSVTVDSPIVATVPPATTWEYVNVKGAASFIQVDATVSADSKKIAASSSPTAVGDNATALNIARLMSNKQVIDSDNDGITDNGSSFHDYLHSMLAEIGTVGKSATYESDSNSAMVKFLQDKRDSLSGVSLDEESAKLMQFEKSFQALGKFMGTVTELTSVIMQIVQ
ncbi:MAG: flagellar hook-associated protein FlgK [Candidatus Omnitrophota bacterium]